MHVQQLMAFFSNERKKENSKKDSERERGRNKKRKKRIISLASYFDLSLRDTANYIIFI